MQARRFKQLHCCVTSWNSNMTTDRSWSWCRCPRCRTGSTSSTAGRQISSKWCTKDCQQCVSKSLKMKSNLAIWMSSSRLTSKIIFVICSVMWCILSYKSFILCCQIYVGSDLSCWTSRIYASWSGITLSWTKDIAWKTRKASSLKPLGQSINQNIECCWRELRCRTTCRSCGHS